MCTGRGSAAPWSVTAIGWMKAVDELAAECHCQQDETDNDGDDRDEGRAAGRSATGGNSTSRSSRWAARRNTARRPMRSAGSVRPRGSDRGHATRKQVDLARSCDDADDAWSAPVAAIDLGGRRARPGSGRWARRCPCRRARPGRSRGRPWRGPDRSPDRRLDPARLDVRPAADAADRWSRSAGGCGPSGGSTGPIRATRCRAVGRWRSWAGWLAIAVALLSGIERYDTTLFSVHMVQHILLTLVAAPLIALAAPITPPPAPGSARDAPALDPAGPALPGRPGDRPSRSSPGSCSPAVMWGTHFSPLFDASLEDPLVHDLEHAPVPRRRRSCSGGRPSGSTQPRGGCAIRPGSVYVFLQMPQNTFLAVAILNASERAVPALRDAGTAVGVRPARGPAARGAG